MGKSRTRGVYSRGNIWWIRYAGLDGKTVYESSGSVKKRDAEALLHKRKAQIKEGKQTDIKRIGNYSFKDLADRYVVWCERQQAYRKKLQVINQLVRCFGQFQLRRFNTMMLETHQSGMLNAEKKPATVNRHIATIKHMFTKAIEWDMVEEETLKRVRKVKMLKENNQRLRYLSKDESQVLVNACDTHLKPIVVTALNSGMRKGEILTLKWHNIDLKHGFVLLDRTKNGERREIPINGTLKESLESLYSGTKERPRRVDIPYVFYDPKSEKPYQNVKRSFNSACRRAGIKDFRFHDLRHTFASQLVMAGADLTTVRELLGHKTLTMTLRYAHLAPSHKAKAVSLLDSQPAENSIVLNHT